MAYPTLHFQDASGSPLANGYLLIRLNTDAKSPIGEMTARLVKVSLDGSGTANVSSLQLEAALTNNLSAAPKYILSAYTATGQLAFGPKYLTDLL